MASVYTVSQVNAYIKNMFAQDFALTRISIKGEVSNCKYHSSGHIYFTLKDGRGTLSAVMFAGQRKGLSFQLEEGQEVVVTGAVDVYERDGKYQLYAREITREGRGDLFLRFEKLRNELEEMGMFAPEYKQPIPRYAKTVGIVTASTGAAIRDIMNISARRNPYVQLILCPALVQGAGAAKSIASGIRRLDAMGLDVLIVGRGGGSIEDLWAFNEEEVARAIFECSTPVISAVGHETDVTIADYAADLRAPTPSAAAELAVFDYQAFSDNLEGIRSSLYLGMERKLEQKKSRLSQAALRLKLQAPAHQLLQKQQYLADLKERMGQSLERKLTDRKHHLALAAGRLHGLSPLQRISSGFGFLTDAAGNRICSTDQVKPKDPFTVRIRDGKITAQVLGTEKE